MTPLRRVVKRARKWCICDDHYPPNGSALIGVGDPCVVLSLPPGRDPNYKDHWWVLRLHPECENWQEPKREPSDDR